VSTREARAPSQIKKKNLPIRILYLGKWPIRNEGEIKIFPDKQKLSEFVTTMPALSVMLKGVFQAE
jgi:hypothetical protein